jgi:hypothetical protein
MVEHWTQQLIKWKIQLGYLCIVVEAHSPASVEKVEQLGLSFQNFLWSERNSDAQKNLVVAIGLDAQGTNLLLHDLRNRNIQDGHTEHWLYAPKRPKSTDAQKILACVEAMVVSWYASTRRGLLLHAASVCSQGKGFIFLGESGAGKSTVALNSAKVGISVLGEDRVLVLADDEQSFILSIAPTLPPQLITHPGLRPPLKGIFVLLKSSSDRLVPMSQAHSARMLFKAFQEQSASSVLAPSLLRNAFQTACNIARHVPGYYLYLRNSLDFWDVINAEFFN